MVYGVKVFDFFCLLRRIRYVLNFANKSSFNSRFYFAGFYFAGFYIKFSLVVSFMPVSTSYC